MLVDRCALRGRRVRASSTAILALVLVLIWIAPAAFAAPITVTFEGTVAAGTIGWGTATAGAPLTGIFTFDDALTDALNSTDGAARWGVGALTSGLTVTITAGGKTENDDSLTDTNGAFVQAFDDSYTNDTLQVSIGALALSFLGLAPNHSSVDVLDDGLTIDPISSAVSILNGFDPADFPNSASSSYIVSSSERVLFTVGSFTVVPEPFASLLLGLGLVGLAASRRPLGRA